MVFKPGDSRAGRPSRKLDVKWTVQVSEEIDRAVRRWATEHSMVPSEAVRILVRAGLRAVEGDGG